MGSSSVDYQAIDSTYYEDQAKAWNPLRSWFHVSRHRIVAEMVKRNYPKDGQVVDFGCGNCLWNTFGARVIGVDENEGLLQTAIRQKRISQAVCRPILDSKIVAESCDVVVCSEVLEHLSDYPLALKEFYRVLKQGGHLVVSVPFDTAFSLWRPFFSLQCFWRGTLLGEQYYQQACGHVNHFSPQRISQAIQEAGFRIVSLRHNHFFTIFVDAQK